MASSRPARAPLRLVALAACAATAAAVGFGRAGSSLFAGSGRRLAGAGLGPFGLAGGGTRPAVEERALAYARRAASAAVAAYESTTMATVSASESAGAPRRLSASGSIPDAPLATLTALTGLTALQLDTLESLIAIPEYSTIDWASTYGACENLGDGRGYTVTIWGATTADGEVRDIVNDLARINPAHPIVTKWRAKLNALPPGSSSTRTLSGLCTDIRAAARDVQWQAAVWDVYITTWWQPVFNTYANPRGIALPLTKAAMMDAAINLGTENLAVICTRTDARARPPSTGGIETAWLTEFLTQRWTVQRQRGGNYGPTDRITMQRYILNTLKNTDLHLPLCGLRCYGDTFNIGSGC